MDLPLFDIPFPLRSSPDVPRAQANNIERLRAHGIVRSEAAQLSYSSWKVAELAGYSFHLARGDDLDLCVDLMSFYALFDDPFDGPLGRDPLRAADVCARLVN